MQRTLSRFALLALVGFLLLAGSPARGATYYVSPSGNDGNDGSSPAKAWATPGYGSKQLKGGDTLIILGGAYVLSEYPDDMITPPESGTAAAWTVIKGEAGHRPVLLGRDNLLAAIEISGLSYVRLENLEITHDPRASGQAIWFREGVELGGCGGGGPMAHVVLKDLYIHHLDESAINIRDINDLQILNCNFEYCGGGGIIGPTATAGGVQNLLLKGSRLAYMGHYYQGVITDQPPGDRPDGLGLEPSSGPVEIVDTITEHNFGDGFDSKIANTYIHNCISANNAADHIKIWATNSKIENCLIYGLGDGQESPWGGIVIDTENANAHFEIVNVTLHDNPGRGASYPIYVQYWESGPARPPVTLVLRNTIIANGYGAAYFGPSVNLTAANNLFFRPGDETQVEARGRTFTAAEIESGLLGPGNHSRAPNFVRPAWGAVGDYHLLPGSPGIDQGTATGAPRVDLEYRPRPLGRGFDLGAYEFPPRPATLMLLPLLLD